MSATLPYTSVLFDLDGTMIDSAPGIIDSLEDTFRHFGWPIPPRSELLHYVGPPLIDSFRNRLGLDEAHAWEALRVYRQDYRRDGALDAPLFPGVAGLLEDLHAAQIPLAIATSKPESQAIRVLDHLSLASLFTVVSGATEDETRASKSDIITHALLGLRTAGADTSRPVLIGDRVFDVEGAASNGIPAIIVEWGYGSPEEAADALTTVYSTDQLHALLLRSL